MHRSSLPHSVLIILVVLLLSPALAQGQVGTPVPVEGYEATDLGTLGGTYSEANGINEAGQVVGSSTTAPDQEPFGPGTHAYLWADGTMTDLGTLGGETSSAIDINEAGQVVGDSETADGATRATLWHDGEVVDFGTLGGDHSTAIRINDAGQIVGHSTTAPGQELLDPGTHAFVWEDGQMTDLGTLGSDFSRATSINEAGQIVGTSETADGAIHPFLWEDGEMTDLGTIPGFGGGRAIRNNDDGWVVGFAVDPLPDGLATPAAGVLLERHAWLYPDGDLIDLGTLGGTNSAALALNNYGQVVGYSEVAVDVTPGVEASPAAGEESPPPTHAFIWQDGVMTDLNDLTSGGELVIEAAFTVNDAGQIAGGAIVGEEYHAFLLAPLQGQ
jgi:probable HAF family extracellular repeat protein